MDTNSTDQIVYGDTPSEWEQEGATSLCETIARATYGLSPTDIGLVRGFLGDVPVTVLTLSRERGEFTSTIPVAVLLLGDNGARIVDQLTFPGMDTPLSKNPDYAGPVAATV